MTLLNLFAILLVLTSVIYVVVKYTMAFDLNLKKDKYDTNAEYVKNIEIIKNKKNVTEGIAYVFIVVGLVHVLFTSSGNQIVGAKSTGNLILYVVLCLVILALGIVSIFMSSQIVNQIDSVNDAIKLIEFEEEKGIFVTDVGTKKQEQKYKNELYGIIVNGIIVGCSGILYSLLLMYAKTKRKVKLV